MVHSEAVAERESRRHTDTSPRALFIEACDFDTFPAGGQLSMARSLVKLFGSQFGLVGMTRNSAEVGRWTRKTLHGHEIWSFAVCAKTASARRPWIPARLTFYSGVRRYQNSILRLGTKAVFTSSPEGLLAASRWDMQSLCYMFPASKTHSGFRATDSRDTFGLCSIPWYSTRWRARTPFWPALTKTQFAPSCRAAEGD